MLIPITQALCAVQQRLHGLNGLFRAEAALRAEPGCYSLAEHFSTVRHLQIALIEEWRLQQFLPAEAPNDPQQTLPGAA